MPKISGKKEKVTQGRKAKKVKKVKKEKEKEEEVYVLGHELVPDHILLTRVEADQLMKKYRIKPFQMPKIKESDPAIKSINGKSGDIVKILRSSPTAGVAEYFRYVIKE